MFVFRLNSINVKAQDDVYVDLSVLNDISSGGSTYIASEPMFPIVKKSEPKKVVKKSQPAQKKKAPVQKIEVVKQPKLFLFLKKQ